jgi:hypothetical protein
MTVQGDENHGGPVSQESRRPLTCLRGRFLRKLSRDTGSVALRSHFDSQSYPWAIPAAGAIAERRAKG